MFAASEHQVIWGANYFCQYLPPSMGWLFWDKGQRICGSDGELAFTSFQSALRVIELNRVEIALDGAVHPTQKPVRLMEWCVDHVTKLAKRCEVVLDPFGGSGTTLVVAKKLNRQWIGFELSAKYAEQALARIGAAKPGQPLNGVEDPKLSAPATAQGKRRKNHTSIG